MKTRLVSIGMAVLLLGMSFNVAAKEFKVNGIQAWSEAKKNGFLFFPDGTNGNKTGAGEKGKAATSTGMDCMGRPSHMVGGVNMILNKCYVSAPAQALNQSSSAQAYFVLFYGKQLKPGWKIKSMKFSGPIQYARPRYKPSSQNIATRIKVTNSSQQTSANKAMLKEVVLIGPSNGNWTDAFDVR